MTKKEIKTSAEFKAQATKVIISIGLFILTYLLLLLLSVGITALCAYAGIMLIITIPKVITIGFGIGLASLGIFILFFLLKFLFKSHKIDRSHLYEIKKTQEPELFNLIDSIVKKVGTTFPKKVYLSTEVNAAVFYDSSFWSMFMPIKKNLLIGLGLVNTITKEELTAIMAHEFGHFSQKTMKVGSYVYNVNQIIFNMLYDNESFYKIAQGWANVSGYFSIFVIVAIKITESIQWILRRMYDLVNMNYMGLSREMEFHADAIAASVTGCEPLKNSLLRMSLADHAFNTVLNYYANKTASNLKSENIYKDQFFVMKFLASDNNIPLVNEFPIITTEYLKKFNKSKLVVKDQWASHPSTEDRIERLEKNNCASEQVEYVMANKLFSNIEQIQKILTNNVFKNVDYSSEASIISSDAFQTEYKQEFLNNTFPKIYNGYYDNKNPVCFEINNVSSIEDNITIKELFSNEKVDCVYTAIALQNDIETLKLIAQKIIPIKKFDYNGRKYKWKECQELISKLHLELENLNEQIKQNDIKIFEFFSKYEQKQSSSSQLENLYQDFFETDKLFNVKYEIYTNLSNELQFINVTTPFEQIKINFTTKVEPLENKLKDNLKELLADSKYQSEITKDMKENFELYLSKQWTYFEVQTYHEDNLNILVTVMNNYAFLLSRGYFLLKKKLLNYQEDLLKNVNV